MTYWNFTNVSIFLARMWQIFLFKSWEVFIEQKNYHLFPFYWTRLLFISLLNRSHFTSLSFSYPLSQHLLFFLKTELFSYAIFRMSKQINKIKLNSEIKNYPCEFGASFFCVFNQIRPEHVFRALGIYISVSSV